MPHRTSPVKTGSLRPWRGVLTIAAALSLAPAAAGCLIVEEDRHCHGCHAHGDDGGGYTSGPPATEAPMLVSIDAGQSLSAVPGEGAGVFVEYGSGGEWRVWTTCDSNATFEGCAFDVFATVEEGATLEVVSGDELEGYDDLAYDAYAVSFYAETFDDVDGFRFKTTPGAIVRLEAYLGKESAARYVFWIGDGVIHQGAPTNPVDFEPSTP